MDNFSKYSKVLQINDSGIGCFVTFLIFGILLGSIGLSWVFNGILILIALLLLLPVIAWIGLNWWLKRSQVNDQCPVCDYEFTAFANVDCLCPNCGEKLQVNSGKFQRITPPGTIDVEAIEVNVKQIED